MRAKLSASVIVMQADATHLENPLVWPPVWLCAEGLSITGLLSDLFDPSELSEVVFEFRPCHRPISEFRFLSKPVTSLLL
jgi:hypothetical protein